MLRTRSEIGTTPALFVGSKPGKLKSSFARFWGIFWVDVGTKLAAETHFSDIAEILGCPKTIDGARKALSNLPSTKTWPLILDNADDLRTDYHAFVPSGDRGAILMTSRNHECHNIATDNDFEELGQLNNDECRELFRKTARLSTDLTSQNDLDDLLHDLEYHTLAILQAGSFIATRHCSIPKYRVHLKKSRRKVLEMSGGQAQSRYATVYATFAASLEFLGSPAETDVAEETGQDALQLLQILSNFHRESFPIDALYEVVSGAKRALQTPTEYHEYCDLLTEWHVDYIPDFLKTEDEVEFRVDEAVARLESLALVRTDTANDGKDSKTITMHSLVHGWAHDRQSGATRRDALRMNECISALATFGSTNWRPYYYRLLRHFRTTAALHPELQHEAAGSRPVLQVCVQLARTFRLAKQTSMAFELMHPIITQMSIRNNEATKQLRQLYLEYGACSCAKGSGRDVDADSAIWALEAVAHLDEKTLDQHHQDRLENYYILVDSYLYNDQKEKAISSMRQLFESFEGESEESDALQTARYYLAKSLIGGIPSMMPSVKGWNDILTSIRAGMYLNGDSRVPSSLARFSKALLLLEKVVKYKQQQPLSRHSDRLFSHAQFGLNYIQFGLGMSDELSPQLEVALLYTEEILGQKHPESLEAQMRVALSLFIDKRYYEAIRVLERNIEALGWAFGESDKRVLLARQRLILAYARVGRLGEAAALGEHLVDNLRRSAKKLDHNQDLLGV